MTKELLNKKETQRLHGNQTKRACAADSLD